MWRSSLWSAALLVMIHLLWVSYRIRSVSAASVWKQSGMPSYAIEKLAYAVLFTALLWFCIPLLTKDAKRNR